MDEHLTSGAAVSEWDRMVRNIPAVNITMTTNTLAAPTDTKTLDEKRIGRALGDIVENCPPLSRWHPDNADAFADYLRHD